MSGYVSLTDGIEIAGADKTLQIHIDAEEYESVIRAAGDLSEDIKSVTGKTPVTSNASITSDADGYEEGYTTGVFTLTRLFQDPPEEKSRRLYGMIWSLSPEFSV